MKTCALAVVTLLTFVLAGCGDKSKTGADDNGGGGAGATLADKIVGKWEIDTDAMKAAIKEQAADNPLAGMMEGMLEGMQMTFEFKKDGTASMAVNALGQQQNANGTWKAKGESGKTLTLEMTRDGQTESIEVEFLSDDQIKIGGKEGEPDAILNRAS